MDDLVTMGESEEELQERWLKWESDMASQRLKVNTNKTDGGKQGREKSEHRGQKWNHPETSGVIQISGPGIKQQRKAR